MLGAHVVSSGFVSSGADTRKCTDEAGERATASPWKLLADGEQTMCGGACGRRTLRGIVGLVAAAVLSGSACWAQQLALVL
eukprot:12304192-Alexandrium_andersonii.AAC.1